MILVTLLNRSNDAGKLVASVIELIKFPLTSRHTIVWRTVMLMFHQDGLQSDFVFLLVVLVDVESYHQERSTRMIHYRNTSLISLNMNSFLPTVEYLMFIVIFSIKLI